MKEENLSSQRGQAEATTVVEATPVGEAVEVTPAGGTVEKMMMDEPANREAN